MSSPRPFPALSRPLSRVRRALLLRRRALAVLLVCAAGVLAMAATTSPPPPSGVAMVVAASDLPAGTVLDAGDLETVTVAVDRRPASAVDRPRALVGRRLAVELRRGEPLGTHRLAGAGLAGTAPGLTAVPVRLADGTALLRAGDRLDLVSSDGQGEARTIARGLPVLGTTGDAPTGGASAGWGAGPEGGDGSGGADGGLVVLGVPATQVDAVVGAHAAGSLFFTFSP